MSPIFKSEDLQSRKREREREGECTNLATSRKLGWSADDYFTKTGV